MYLIVYPKTYLTPIRMATITHTYAQKKKKKKERKENMLARMQGNYKCQMVWLLWKTVWWFLKEIKNRITVWSSDSISGSIPKRIENRILCRYLYIHIHSSIIHHSQNVEVTQKFIDRWMDKQNTVYVYKAILLSLKKKFWSSLHGSVVNESD